MSEERYVQLVFCGKIGFVLEGLDKKKKSLKKKNYLQIGPIFHRNNKVGPMLVNFTFSAGNNRCPPREDPGLTGSVGNRTVI